MKELMNANIHVAMITGDNLQTASAVAKKCYILPENDNYQEIQVEEDGNVQYISDNNQD